MSSPPCTAGVSLGAPRRPKTGIFGGASGRDSARAGTGRKAAVWGLWREGEKGRLGLAERAELGGGGKGGGWGSAGAQDLGGKRGDLGCVSPPPAGNEGGKEKQIEGKNPKSRGKTPNRGALPAGGGGVGVSLTFWSGSRDYFLSPPPAAEASQRRDVIGA